MPAGSFLDFFVLEAGEYVEQLDGLLLRASTGGPETEPLLRAARALRGSATMAKLNSFAQLAGGLERVSQGIADRRIPWDDRVKGVLVATVDDLKVLLRKTRSWSVEDDDRAMIRLSELTSLVPPDPHLPQESQRSSNVAYFAAEASNIAAGLELLATRPGDRPTAEQVLRRVQALRGVAGVGDVPELSEILDNVDESSRTLTAADEPLRKASNAVLRSAARVLRTLATELRSGSPPDRSAPERQALATATEEWSERDLETEKVVPISDLFHDEGPTLVERAPNPPTSFDDRLRLDLISRGEHLHGLLDWARGHTDAPAHSVRRRLLRALSSIGDAARSFGVQDLAARVELAESRLRSSNVPDLPALEQVAAALRQPTPPAAAPQQSPRPASGATPPGAPTAGPQLTPPRTPRFTPALPVRSTPAATPGSTPTVPPRSTPTVPLRSTPTVPPRSTPTVPPRSTPAVPRLSSPTATPRFSPVVPPRSTPAATPRFTPAAAQRLTPAAKPQATPGAADVVAQKEGLPAGDLLAAIDAGIASIDRLKEMPLAKPSEASPEAIVPIEQLLYRGRAALERAKEIRDELRSAGTQPRGEAMEELFDLLDVLDPAIAD